MTENREGQDASFGLESDEYFAVIIGYTSGGFPYEITLEEMEEVERK